MSQNEMDHEQLKHLPSLSDASDETVSTVATVVVAVRSLSPRGSKREVAENLREGLDLEGVNLPDDELDSLVNQIFEGEPE